MATIEIATKASTALTLPCLLTVLYLEHSKALQTVTIHFKDVDSLPSGGYVRFTAESKDAMADKAAMQRFLELSLEGASSQRSSSIKTWVERSDEFAKTDFASLRNPFEDLNAHLTLRTHVVGHSLSIADLAVWATIRGNRVAQGSVKKVSNNVSRWYAYIESSNSWIATAIAELNASAAREKAVASAAGASFEIDLPEMTGPMVTRFPPEPSGYLHIGHAKAALLNDYFAHQKAGGVLICRFDDTNPSKESMEFQDAIIHDLKLMEIVPEKTTFSSDYFQEMYEYAIQLIKDGKAFADDSELGKGDEDRKNRLPSKRRDLSIEETLGRFEDMKSGSTEGRRWCLRARIAYDSPNGTLRDPVIYRCNDLPHHRTGTKWKIYPTYDFCAPILDSIEGVTLALRTNEYRDRNVQYEWMQEALRLRKVPIWDFSRMNFVRTVLSKRKLTRIVNEGRVWGWDDPRMPTVRGILRRGMTVSALREFVLKQGPSRNILNLEWGMLWATNKKVIDPTASRFTAVEESKAVRCRIAGIEAPEVAEKPKHAKHTQLGMKRVMYSSTIVVEQADAQTFREGEEITLMNWGNAYVRKIEKSSDGAEVAGIEMELHLQGDFKKTEKKITWLAAESSNMVSIDLVSFDYLITKDKLEKEDTLEDFLTPKTEFRTPAFADCNVAELPQGCIIQFDRKGYFRLDRARTGSEDRMVFFNVPTGRL